MGGNTNFGSRSEFLPGERSDDMDIKYGRYGGCFITYKRGLLYVIVALLFTAIVSYLVYFYGHSTSCRHEVNSVEEKTDNFLAELLKAAEDNQNQVTKDSSKISSDLYPLYYSLKIQPYLNENGPDNFSFEGQVSIVFHITSPTTTIALNVKDLEIPQTEVTVTYTTSKPESASLIAESQIKDNQTNLLTTTESSVENITEFSGTVKPTLEPKVSEANLTQTFTLDNTTNPEESNTTLSSISDSASDISSVSVKPEITTIVNSEVIIESKENSMEVHKQNYNEKDETYTIKLKFPLKININYTLNMKFKGKVSNGDGGILRSSYKQGNNTKWMIYTLLKPSFARTVFPCFDQPSFKSKFEIAVARRTNMTVVSNMYLQDTYEVKNSSGWVWDHFVLTPLMSPHSVAFAVFDFNPSNSTNSVPNPSTKIWGRSEMRAKGNYALNIIPKLIGAYNKFFEHKYSLNKIDLVAIPNLPVGSYGSWGILFFREKELLIEETSSFEGKENLLHSLSRELAQEWFGNLISVQSWSDSWLTETISHYAHYIGINSVEPEWNVMSSSFASDAQEVLDAGTSDLLPKISSISANFEKDLDQQLLIAKKGSMVMRMLNASLTEPEFTTGIRNFVHKWKYKKFLLENFWEEFNSTLNLPSEIKVKDIVQLWINQKGYPLVNVTNNKNGSLSLQQLKFSKNGTADKNTWILPLILISDSNSSNEIIWLTDKSPKTLENNSPSWVFFTSAAPCRINYNLDNWNSLIMLLKSSPEVLSDTNRAQLLGDAFHLARTGVLNYSVVLNMSLYLKDKESDIIPWMSAMKNFQYLDTILSKTPNYGYFEDFIIKLIKPKYESLIQDTNKDYTVTKLKKLIINWACKLNYKPCRDWTISQYDTWSKSTNPNDQNAIPKDLRSIVYCTGVQNYGRSAWNFLWKQYENAKYDSDESRALIIGMGCTTESWLLMKYLFRALEEEDLQNSVLMWTSLSSEIALNSAFQFLRENLSKVQDKYKQSKYSFKQILLGTLNKLATQNDLEQVLDLFSTEKSKFKDFIQDMVIIAESLGEKVSWKKNHMTSFNSWIQNNNL